MTILFVDCETTGKPKKDSNWQTDYKHFPRIVSIAWRLTGSVSHYYIINQGGVKIPPRATEIHGITDEMCASSTYTIDNVLLWLIEDALVAEKIVGHNLYFDTSIVKAAVLRVFGPDSARAESAIKAFDKFKRIDTMRRAAKHCGGWSTLEGLYFKLFGRSPKDDGLRPHNAYADLKILEACFDELVKLKIIEI